MMVMSKPEVLGTSHTAVVKETLALAARRGRCGSAVTKEARSLRCSPSFLLWFVSAAIA